MCKRRTSQVGERKYCCHLPVYCFRCIIQEISDTILEGNEEGKTDDDCAASPISNNISTMSTAKSFSCREFDKLVSGTKTTNKKLTICRIPTQHQRLFYRRHQSASEAYKPKCMPESKVQCPKMHWAQSISTEAVRQVRNLGICVHKVLPSIGSKRAQLGDTGRGSKRRTRRYR